MLMHVVAIALILVFGVGLFCVTLWIARLDRQGTNPDWATTTKASDKATASHMRHDRRGGFSEKNA
jgi:transposase